MLNKLTPDLSLLASILRGHYYFPREIVVHEPSGGHATISSASRRAHQSTEYGGSSPRFSPDSFMQILENWLPNRGNLHLSSTIILTAVSGQAPLVEIKTILCGSAADVLVSGRSHLDKKACQLTKEAAQHYRRKDGMLRYKYRVLIDELAPLLDNLSFYDIDKYCGNLAFLRNKAIHKGMLRIPKHSSPHPELALFSALLMLELDRLFMIHELGATRDELNSVLSSGYAPYALARINEITRSLHIDIRPSLNTLESAEEQES